MCVEWRTQLGESSAADEGVLGMIGSCTTRLRPWVLLAVSQQMAADHSAACLPSSSSTMLPLSDSFSSASFPSTDPPHIDQTTLIRSLRQEIAIGRVIA